MKNMKELITFDFDGEALRLFRTTYVSGGGDAYAVCDRDGMPYVTLSVNIPEVPLGPGEVLIKTWAENEDIAPRMLELGVFKDTGRRVPNGFVQAEVWVYTGVA